MAWKDYIPIVGAGIDACVGTYYAYIKYFIDDRD